MDKSHKLPNGFSVEVGEFNDIPYLFKDHVHVVCNPIVLQEIIKMRELLMAVHTHVGYTFHTQKPAVDAISAVDDYINNLPK